MKERFRPQPENQKNNAPEAGAGPIGLPPPSPERQPLPDVWDVLERKARRYDNLSRMTKDESEHEQDELNRLKDEIDEKGTDRDKHILSLLYNRRPRLSLLSEQQQINEWRSEVEQMSDDEIAECASNQREEIAAFRRGEIPIMSFHPSAGDGELILAQYIRKKSKKG
jgi:hypothetical protein